MPYLIDSDVVIDHLAAVPAATQLLEQLATDGIAVSIITYMEAYQGVLRSPHQTRARKQNQTPAPSEQRDFHKTMLSIKNDATESTLRLTNL